MSTTRRAISLVSTVTLAKFNSETQKNAISIFSTIQMMRLMGPMLGHSGSHNCNVHMMKMCMLAVCMRFFFQMGAWDACFALILACAAMIDSPDVPLQWSGIYPILSLSWDALCMGMSSLRENGREETETERTICRNNRRIRMLLYQKPAFLDIVLCLFQCQQWLSSDATAHAVIDTKLICVRPWHLQALSADADDWFVRCGHFGSIGTMWTTTETKNQNFAIKYNKSPAFPTPITGWRP